MSVFTPVSPDELTGFLRAYTVGTLVDYVGIEAGVENTNFFVTTTQGRFVLTLFEQYEAEELGFFLQLTEFLADRGIPTARPLHNRQGQLLDSLNGRPAALVMRLNGNTLTHPNRQQCAAIGRTLAQLHLAAQDFPLHRPPDRGHHWRMQTAHALLPHLPADEAQVLNTEIRLQEGIPFAHLPGSVIHADLFCDNALFEQDQLSGIIDWYYACNDSWLYDLAVVANDWCCHPDGALDPERLQACLEAYQHERPLLAAEEQHWAPMLRAAALRFWLSRLLAIRHPRPGNMVLQKDPREFLHKLLHRRQEDELIRTHWPRAL